MTLWRFAPILLALAGPAHAQKRLDPHNTYERILCVVPMVGAGTAADPKRPLYSPAGDPEPGGILAFAAQISDDGRFALIEFVARDRAAFKHILDEKRPDVKVFVKGRAKKDDVEREFRRYKKDFDLTAFGVAAQ